MCPLLFTVLGSSLLVFCPASSSGGSQGGWDLEIRDAKPRARRCPATTYSSRGAGSPAPAPGCLLPSRLVLCSLWGYLLSAHVMPGAAHGPGDTATNCFDCPCAQGACILVTKSDDRQENSPVNGVPAGGDGLGPVSRRMAMRRELLGLGGPGGPGSVCEEAGMT